MKQLLGMLTVYKIHNTIFLQITCLQNIARWKIVLLRGRKVIAGWADGEVATLILI
jgi:hypothetical protein